MEDFTELSQLKVPSVLHYAKLRQEPNNESLSKTLDFSVNQRNIMDIVIKNKNTANKKSSRTIELLNEEPMLHEIVDFYNNNIFHHSIYNTDAPLMEYLKNSKYIINTVDILKSNKSEIPDYKNINDVLPVTLNGFGKTPIDIYTDILFEVNTYMHYIENLITHHNNFYPSPTYSSKRAIGIARISGEKTLNESKDIILSRQLFSTLPQNKNYPITLYLKKFRNLTLNLNVKNGPSLGKALNKGDKFISEINKLNPIKNTPPTNQYITSTGVLPLRFIITKEFKDIVKDHPEFHYILSEADPRI